MNFRGGSISLCVPYVLEFYRGGRFRCWKKNIARRKTRRRGLERIVL